MKDIKTKKVVKGTIKTLDKASIAAERMKTSYAKTKEKAESSYRAKEASPSEYAADNILRVEKLIAREGGYKLNKLGKKNFEATKTNIINRRLQRSVKTKAISVERLNKGKLLIKDNKRHPVKGKTPVKITVGNIRQRNFAKQFAQKNIYASKQSVKKSKRIFKALRASVKSLAVATRAIVSAIIAGGWVAMIVIVICCLFGAAFYFFGDDTANNYIPVSSEVEQYDSTIRKYAKEYGIPEYVELIKAVMMQESGGNGTDPMQSSECSYNTKYPNTPGSIKDPEYSIDCGVHYLSAVMKPAKVGSPVDIERISLALQGYNFGAGYIDWAIGKYGGYTKANAVEFAKLQGGSYGDTDYVDHVLRYYPYGKYSYDIVFTGPGKLGLPIKGMTQKNISSRFGPRNSPGGIGSTNHKGLDIAFPTGTHVLSCESGKVTHAGWMNSFGKCIFVDHGGGLVTIYAHLSKINVAEGQKVVRGQFIGEVGSTGNSTGPHLHLGVMVKGSYVNPEKGYLSIPK